MSTETGMTREALAEWLQMRGVDGGQLDELLIECAGLTEDELEDIYDSTSGSIASAACTTGSPPRPMGGFHRLAP